MSKRFERLTANVEASIIGIVLLLIGHRLRRVKVYGRLLKTDHYPNPNCCAGDHRGDQEPLRWTIIVMRA